MVMKGVSVRVRVRVKSPFIRREHKEPDIVGEIAILRQLF